MSAVLSFSPARLSLALPKGLASSRGASELSGRRGGEAGGIPQAFHQVSLAQVWIVASQVVVFLEWSERHDPSILQHLPHPPVLVGQIIVKVAAFSGMNIARLRTGPGRGLGNAVNNWNPRLIASQKPPPAVHPETKQNCGSGGQQDQG